MKRGRKKIKPESLEAPINGGSVATLEKEQKYIVLNQPDIGDLEIEAVTKVLRSRWLSTGQWVKEFETAFEKHMGDGYAVALSSCTDALLIALKILSVGSGLEVITSPLTFAATANAILLAGAKPVFVDVDVSGNLDPEKIRFSLTNKTRAIIPVHLYGAPCDMARICVAAKSFELSVIEDAAHAFGGEYIGPGYRKKLGTIGEFGCFSFYPNKNITSGEGGMLVTKRADWAERARAISMQGLTKNAWNRYGNSEPSGYEVMHEGIKANMSDVHAAIGYTQLLRWPELKRVRDVVWAIYEQAFGPKEPGHSHNIFTIKVKNRDELRRKLHAEGIGSAVHYKPLHLEPGYKFLGYEPGKFPCAEKIGAENLSLPVSATMTPEDAERVVKTVNRYMETV